MSESMARWAMCGCSSGLALTLGAALLLLPAQQWAPDLATPSPSSAPAPRPRDAPPLNLLLTLALLMLGVFIYLCEWIQRKIMEKRIVKLNRYLCASVERLRAWDAQQEQLETTLRLVQSATSEYNLLLFLLLRQRAAPGPFLDKEPPPALHI